MNKRAIITAILLSLVSACAGSNNEISTQVESQFRASSTAPVNLALVGPASWEQVCVLGPYTNNERAEKILGFKWDAEGKTSIAGSDDVNVLAFVNNHEVIAYTEHPRNIGDFSELKPQCLTRAQATVVRKSDSDGWVYLVTNEQSITESFKRDRTVVRTLSAAECLPYEPAEAVIEGTVVKKTVPGRPNFESIADGDEKLIYWMLELDKPVCVGSPGTAAEVNESEAEVLEIQLAPRDDKFYKQHRGVIGKHVKVTGALFHQNSAWHVAKVVVRVNGLSLVQPGGQPDTREKAARPSHIER